jgi:hypothetical protein
MSAEPKTEFTYRQNGSKSLSALPPDGKLKGSGVLMEAFADLRNATRSIDDGG